MFISNSRFVLTKKQHRCYVCRKRFEPKTIMVSWVSIPTSSDWDFCHGHDCLLCYYTVLAAGDANPDYEFVEDLYAWNNWNQERAALKDCGIEGKLTHWSKAVREAAIQELAFFQKRPGLLIKEP